MKKTLTTLVLAIVLTPALAMAQKVSYDYDKTTNFAALKTYAHKDGTKVGQPLIDDRIVAAIDTQMAAKGFTKATANPDAVVVYHIAFDKQKDISTFSSGYGGGYGPYGWGWGGGWAGGTTTTQVRDILMGTLVIDIADARKKQLAWRGMGTKEVDMQAKPEKRDKNLNKGAEKMYGWTCEEVMGKHLHSLLHTEFPKPMEDIVKQLYGEGQYSGEVIQVARDGRRVPTLCRWVLDLGTDSILTSYTDITERTRMEDELRRAHTQLAGRAGQLEQAVSERTEQLRDTVGELQGFSYSVSHDMRAPLRAMQSYASYLIDEYGGKLDEQGADYLRQIMRSATRLDRLIQDVLSYTRILHAELPMKPVDLDRLVRDVAETFANVRLMKPTIRIKGTLATL